MFKNVKAGERSSKWEGGKRKEMNKKERSLFRTFPLQFTVQGVNICFSLFKFPGDVGIQPLKFKQKKLSHVVWMLNKTETISLSGMFSRWDSPCVCSFFLMGMHTGVFVCDKALSCSHSSQPLRRKGASAALSFPYAPCLSASLNH